MIDSIVIEDFVFENKLYVLNQSLVLEKVIDSDLVFYCFKDLNIYIEENDIGLIKEEFYKQFTLLYKFYTKMKDKRLPTGAIEIKKILLNLVKEVKRVKR